MKDIDTCWYLAPRLFGQHSRSAWCSISPNRSFEHIIKPALNDENSKVNFGRIKKRLETVKNTVIRVRLFLFKTWQIWIHLIVLIVRIRDVKAALSVRPGYIHDSGSRVGQIKGFITRQCGSERNDNRSGRSIIAKRDRFNTFER